MPKLPTTRQNRLNLRRGESGESKRRSLATAFRTFTQAAGSLERSYAQLQGEVARLRHELENANAELSRRAEENVRAHAFLAQILEGLPCGVVVTDVSRRPLVVNPEAQRLLGLSESQDCLPSALDNLFSIATPGSFCCEQESSFESAAGLRILGISGARVESSDPALVKTIWIIRDISDQKRAAAEREDARRAHALAEIAAVLAHEIRNPLASMELFADLLNDATQHNPDAHQWVVHLRAGLCLLAATVNNVLQFHSQPCAEKAPSSVDRLLRETTSFLGPLARERGVQIAIENHFDEANVLADSHRLQQVFFNLALNAFNAMNSGGTLTIRVNHKKSASDTLHVSFMDEGCGIGDRDLKNIFEPGFTTKAGSPGLGLSVCRKVIEQHGGSIAVESEVGQGSTFSIFLPVAEELNVSRPCGR